jgi:preprotein translocase subunit SecE
MNLIGQAREFFKEVVLEFRRVTWPTRQQLVNSTVVVLAVTVAIAFFLGGVDIGLARIVERILR